MNRYKYLVGYTVVLVIIVGIAIFRGYAIASDEDEAEVETKTYTFPVIEIMTPNMATLDGYLKYENVFGKISRIQISKILRDLNGKCFPVNTNVASTIVTHVTNGKASGHSQSTSISFREGKKIFLVDFNGDFKSLGIKGKVIKSVMLNLPAEKK